MSLQPLPESRDALASMAEGSGRNLTAELLGVAAQVEDLVPNLVGLSVSLVEEGLTFTLAASSEHVALLDAIQYAVGGPCVDAAREDVVIRGGDTEQGLLDEERWAHFAREGAAHGVLSTLSLPIHSGGRVVCGANLYAATPNAFAGREEPIAQLLRAWAPGAVHNADLTFATRAAARRAPRLLADMRAVDLATGMVMAAQGVDREEARAIIADAAHRAGQDELEVARALVRSLAEGQDAP